MSDATKGPSQAERLRGMDEYFDFLVRVDLLHNPPCVVTGFMVSPEYVLTCAHVAMESPYLSEASLLERFGKLSANPVRVRFNDGLDVTGIATKYVRPDCALVRLDVPIHRSTLRLISRLRREHLPSMLGQAPFAAGYAGIASDKLGRADIRQIVAPFGVLDSPYLFDYQIEGGMPIGLSGAPVLVKIQGTWGCAGMVYLGGAGAARSRVIASQALLDFLDKERVALVPPLHGDACFPTQASQPALDAEQHRNTFLLHATFAGRVATSDDAISLPEVYVHRIDQESEILRLIERHGAGRGTWISVQGHAGSGKSSLLWFLYDLLSCAGEIIVQPFVAQKMSEDFRAEVEVVSFRTNGAVGSKCVVLIDTLDLIVGRGDRALCQFIADLRFRRVIVVTTCRPLEAQRLVPLHEPGHVVELNIYSPRESKDAVGKYVHRVYPHLSIEEKRAQEKEIWNILDNRRQVQELTLEPLILRMIFEAYPPDPVPAEINTALIYTEYWKRCVVTDRLRESKLATEMQREKVACCLADSILFRDGPSFDDTIRIPDFELAWRESGDQTPFPYDVIESLQSSHVIESAGGSVHFFHQTLLEFASARHILSSSSSLQQQRIHRIFADLVSGVFVRVPVLVQIAVQDARDKGRTCIEVLSRLLDLASELACYLTLEILGKVPDKPEIASGIDQSGILSRWRSEHFDKFAESALATIGFYPKPRIAFGLTILESILCARTINKVLALAERLAVIDPKAVLNFLRRIVDGINDPKVADGNACGHYKTALFVCLDGGEPDAIRILGDVFSRLNEGQRHGALEALARRIDVHTCAAAGDLLQCIKWTIQGDKANELIRDYLTVWTALHRADPTAAERLAKELRDGPQPTRIDDAALLRGWIDGTLQKEDTIPKALDEVLSETPLERLSAETTLAFLAPFRHDAVIERVLRMDLPNLSDSVRGSLFTVVANLAHASSSLVIEFLRSCPWPENTAGKAWRKICDRIAADAPDVFKTWLFTRMRERGMDRMISVGLNYLLVSRAGVLTYEESDEAFGAVLNADLDCRRALAETTGSVAAVNPEAASRIVKKLILPRHSALWPSLAYSFRHALRTNSIWVSANMPALIHAALSRKDDGTISKLLEGLRDWPEGGRLELARLLDENLTSEALEVFPQEKCQVEFLLLVKLVAKPAPELAFQLMRRAVIATDGTLGAATSVAANIAAHTLDDAILTSLLAQLLHASRNARQPTTRNAIHRGLRFIDRKLGNRTVIKAFFEVYHTVQDPDSLKPLIGAVSKLSSWTEADTDRLLADKEHIKDAVLAFVLRLKKV